MDTSSTALHYTIHPRMLILRGALSIIFGILALLWPGPGLLAIALLYGAYAFADGILAMAAGFRRERQHQSWGLLVLEGVLGIAAGIVTFFWPGITLLALSVLVGIWALTTGILELGAAFNLTKVFPWSSTTGRVVLGLAGLLSIFLGLAIFFFPPLGAIALLTLVASYSLIFGFLMTWLGVQLRREYKVLHEQPVVRAA